MEPYVIKATGNSLCVLLDAANMLVNFAAPQQAVAASIEPSGTEYGWLVENGRNPPDLRYRTMDNSGITWTDDHNKALRFARRADAEMFAAEDEDAWRIAQHAWHNTGASTNQPVQASNHKDD